MKLKIARTATTPVANPKSSSPPGPVAPAALPHAAAALIDELTEQLSDYADSNERAGGIYDQEYRVKLLDLGLPPAAASLRLVMGWGRTVVDVLAERMEPVAWAHPDLDPTVAQQVWEDSGAGSAIAQTIVDMLIYGIGFISATAGDPAKGEPRVLVRAHSARSTTAKLDPRTGRVTAAITRHDDDRVTLWHPNAIVEAERVGGKWTARSISHNPLGVVPMVALPNAPRAGLPGGRSEITPAVRSALFSATRSLIAMDVNREFFAIPHRYLIGVAGEFKNADGSLLETWKLAARAMLKIPYSDDGGDVQVGEFQQVKAGPFLEQIEGLAKTVAAEAGLPAIYLGVEGANPTSADAIRMAESRLVRRTRTRIAALSPRLSSLGQLVFAIHFATPLADTLRPRTEFADPATAAFSADADAWVKLMGAGAVPKMSSTVWRRMGFGEAEILAMQRDARAEALTNFANQLENTIDLPPYDPGVGVDLGPDQVIADAT